MRELFTAILLISVIGFVASLPAQRQLGVRPTDSGGPLLPEQAAYDVTFYDLALRIDPAEQAISGALAAHARIVHPTEWFVVDLDTLLQIEKISLAGNGNASTPLRYERREGRVWIHLHVTKQPGDQIVVRIDYGGKPRVAPKPPWVGGFTWSTTASGEPWIGVSCQGDGADIWWPCKDHPSDEPDSMALHVTVPQPLICAANGRLRRVTQNLDETQTFDWFVSTPINNYGVSLNIAPYRTIERKYTGVTGEKFPVTFWVLPENYEKGAKFIDQIIDHLRFYEKKIGPYPFRKDKYGVAETPYFGMEHQTIIAYGNNYHDNRFGFDFLHHHELAHEWWGNLVTALDWRDFWLHEGFGLYMQAMYAGELHGQQAYHEYMADLRVSLRNLKPVAPRESRTNMEMFMVAPDYVESDGDIYNKGAWILHTLRYVMGDEAFLRALRRMAYPDQEMEKITDGRQCRFATTDDFLALAEEASEMELDWFFEVYLRQPELPRLVSEMKGRELEVHWEVPQALPFPMPVEVKLGDKVQRLEMKEGRATIAVPANVKPVVDPVSWILKENRRGPAASGG